MKTSISRETILDRNKLNSFLERINHLRLASKLADSNELIDELESVCKPDWDELVIATLHHERALNYYNELIFDKAIQSSLSALVVFMKYKDKEQISACLNNLGVFYSAIGLEEKALDYFMQSIDFNENYLPALNNAGNKLYKKGEFAKAEHYLELIIKKAGTSKDVHSLVEANTDLAELNLMKEEPQKALEILNRFEDKFMSAKSFRVRHFHLLAKGKAYLDLGKVKEAEENIFEAYKIACETNNQEMLWFSYKRLILLYEKQRKYRKLCEIYKKSLDLQEKVFNEHMTTRISNIEKAYEVEIKELEYKQILEKNARLASIGVMAAGITHEINQPLNAIVINSDGLIYKDDRDRVLKKDYRISIEQILKAACRIDEIIKHMRSFWASPEFIQYHDIELHQAIEDAISLVNLQLRSHGILLSRDLCDWNPKVKANKTILEQVFINLINNSIQSLDHVESRNKEISISTRIVGKEVLVQVEDNGSGIDADICERIFDPFYSTKSPGEGMGMGLAIVSNFISEIKGEIKCLPTDRAGALFEIKLPLSSGTNDEDISS